MKIGEIYRNGSFKIIKEDSYITIKDIYGNQQALHTTFYRLDDLIKILQEVKQSETP